VKGLREHIEHSCTSMYGCGYNHTDCEFSTDKPCSLSSQWNSLSKDGLGTNWYWTWTQRREASRTRNNTTLPHSTVPLPRSVTIYHYQRHWCIMFMKILHF